MSSPPFRRIRHDRWFERSTAVTVDHPWDVTPQQARRIQLELREQVLAKDDLARVDRVAGVDVGFEQAGAITRAAVAVLSFPELEVMEHVVVRRPTSFPYVPGLLSFREAPAVLEALGRLDRAPDLLLCDGHGRAHPRRFGLACHLGLLSDIPSIGVGKSRLVGTFAEVPNRKGASVPLLDGQETLGAVLRSRLGVKPIFVSIGHRICLDTALSYVIACLTRYRLPETTRIADRLAGAKPSRP